MVNGVAFGDWIMHYLVIGLIVALVISIAFFMIRSLDLNALGKYSIIGFSSIIVVFFLLQSFGYNFFIVFSFIEWSTKFVLPWIVLYWLIRAIKIVEKRR
ncbi:hypothetical protein RYX56_14885 [Alkalihalophilus lindianensis]|uniref:Uncharacterized protein n=1 Tax=Alkalihalophilus lindianensis TaxID=1630542 RepID=A0ABU3XCT1_9BACI|nr:hypothetical protein [Alkalihalophilus lindianensis]MDV2685648.1 hypothetical protein [Alkalihalophilus lindianensis]